MKTQLPEAITTVKDAQKLLTDLFDNGEAYHPEDDATELVEDPFTKEEGEQLNKLMEDIYNLDGNGGNNGTPQFDPCHFLNDLSGMNSEQVPIRVRTNHYGMIVINEQSVSHANMFELSEAHADAFLNSVSRVNLKGYLQSSDRSGDYEILPSTKEELKESFWRLWEGENGPRPSTQREELPATMQELFEESGPSKRYKTLQTKIAAQIKDIQARLKGHSKRQRGTDNWGFVADLGYVTQHLKEITDFIQK